MMFLPLFHLGLTLAAAIAVGSFVGTQSAYSVAAGGGLMLLNICALVFSWPRILEKKSVALAIGVIVFKFAILGLMIYEVATGGLFHLGWFALGMAFVVPTVIVAALRFNPKSPKKGET